MTGIPAGSLPPGAGSLTLISPSSFMLLAALIALFAHAIPASVYEYHLREPFLLSRSWLGLVFYLICIFLLFIGANARAMLSRPAIFLTDLPPFPRRFGLFMLGCIWAAIALNFYSLSVIIGNTPGLLDMLFQGRANEIKSSLDTTGALSQAQPMLIAILTWFLYRYLQAGRYFSLLFRRFLIGSFLLGFALAAAISTVKLARYEIIPLILQSAIVFGVFTLAQKNRVSIRFFLQILAAFAAAITVFMFFSHLRDTGGSQSALQSLLGYSVASFNRLQSVLDGTLNYSYGGTGVYGLRFLAHIPLLHNIVDIGAILGMPDTTTAWRQEFIDMGASGLNPALIWLTAPGYLYVDFGLLSLLIVFCMGFLFQSAWIGFVRGGAVGVIMFPFMATSIALWFTSNLLTSPSLVTLLGTGLALAMCERVWLRRTIRKSRKAELLRNPHDMGVRIQ